MIFRDRVAQMKLVEQLTLVTLQTAHHGSTSPRFASTQRNHASRPVSTDFCNKICQQRKSAVRMQRAAAGPSNRNKPFRVDVRDSLEGTDSPGRLRRSRSKRSYGIFRIEKMSEKGFAGSS